MSQHEEPGNELPQKEQDHQYNDGAGGEETQAPETHELKNENVVKPEGVEMQSNPFTNIEDVRAKVRDWVFPVPMSTVDEESISNLIRDYASDVEKRMTEDAAREAIQAYADHLRQAYLGHWRRGEYSKLFSKPESDWGQSVDSEKGPIRIGNQKVALNSGQNVSGPNALMAIQNAMGIGRPTKIPLWHSGIVLTVGNFKESEMLSLTLAMVETRSEMGYQTGGMLFSGGDVNIVTEIVDFILDHTIATNIRGWMIGDTEVLKEHIKVMDIPALLAGALSAIYPSGYPSVHKCKNTGTDKCNYDPQLEVDVDGIEFKIDSLLDFKKVVWVDRSRVSAAARRHMSAGNNIHTLEQVQEYQDTFNSVEPLSMPISDSGAVVRMALHQPTLREYESMGRMWINGVMEMVTGAMDRIADADNKTRRTKRMNFIRNYQHVLRLQKYGAWIKNLQFQASDDEEPFIIDDKETLFETLESIAEDRDAAKSIAEQVDKYREDSQVVFTGIPNYVCPSCKEPQVDVENARHSLIPMDMVAYFFTITVWRWEREATTLTAQQ